MNLENDIIGKYVEKLLKPSEETDVKEAGGGLTMEMLGRNGFL